MLIQVTFEPKIPDGIFEPRRDIKKEPVIEDIKKPTAGEVGAQINFFDHNVQQDNRNMQIKNLGLPMNNNDKGGPNKSKVISRKS